MARSSKQSDPLDSGEWVGLREAARMLGCSRNRIMALGMRGALVSKYIAGRTVVSKESVEKLREQFAGSAA